MRSPPSSAAERTVRLCDFVARRSARDSRQEYHAAALARSGRRAAESRYARSRHPHHAQLASCRHVCSGNSKHPGDGPVIGGDPPRVAQPSSKPQPREQCERPSRRNDGRVLSMRDLLRSYHLRERLCDESEAERCRQRLRAGLSERCRYPLANGEGLTRDPHKGCPRSPVVGACRPSAQGGCWVDCPYICEAKTD